MENRPTEISETAEGSTHDVRFVFSIDLLSISSDLSEVGLPPRKSPRKKNQ
jgi:hypothetical protein